VARFLLFSSVFGLCLAAPTALAQQHVSLWGGAGLGAFLRGGSKVNYHKFGALAVSFPGDLLQIRGLIGSFERTKDLPSDTRDNDLDYFGFDLAATRRLTGLPFDLAAGICRFEETYHEGYPHRDRGGRVFVHRWGPHLSVLREFPVSRFLLVWGELDAHYAPYRARQIVAFLDIGLGIRL
jgi:hypothetical protein